MRTLDECRRAALDDLTIQTALLEARLLTGNSAVFQELCEQLMEDLVPQAFFEAKRLEQDERHRRYQDSPYSLEPNCKEAPGDYAICRRSCGLPAPQAMEIPGKIWPCTASSPRRKSSNCSAA